MISFFQISPYILEISWRAEISKSILMEIIIFKAKIKEKYGDQLKDCISGYHILSLHFKYPFDSSALMAALEEDYINLKTIDKLPQTLWEIPVFYNGKDLSSLSMALELSEEEIICRHTTPSYLLHFYGFLPGFIYLGGLDPLLHYPRKVNPDSSIPAGSVAIGGKQTGIYPTDSPGGWHILGTCPIKMFDPYKNPAVWAKEGDMIQFYSVEREEYDDMKLLGTGLIKKPIDG